MVNIFANLLVRTGEADGAVMGAVATTAETLRAGLRVLGVAPRFKVVTSCFLMAWPDKPDGRNILCNSSDNVEDCATPAPLQPSDAHIGWEVDFGIKHTWHEHIDFALEAGFAQTSDRIPVEAAGLNPEGKFFTVQSQIQYRF